ncbi:MAG: hypothetical protein RL125_668, partial [Actinomycetota bacterium]
MAVNNSEQTGEHQSATQPRVVLVDAVRTPFGKAGSLYAGTRADDIMVRAI